MSAVLAAWGTAHAIPTRQVLAGFNPITTDNRRIIQQEWLAEAITMWGLAAVTVAATAAGGRTTDTRSVPTMSGWDRHQPPRRPGNFCLYGSQNSACRQASDEFSRYHV